jgi:hypothetical protein
MTQTTQPKKEKKDFKQDFLDMIYKKYGVMDASIMEDAFKNQSKQIETAMLEQGVTAEEIAKTRNIDTNNIGKNIGKSLIGGGIQPEGNIESGANPQILSNLVDSVNSQDTGQRSLPKGPLGAFYPGSDTEQPGGIYKLLTLLAGGGGYKPGTGGGGGMGVYGFDPSTGKVSLQASVPKGSNVRNMQGSNNLESLPTELQPAAYALARKIAGVRGAEKALPGIINNLKAGKTIDQIEDEIRLKGQSPEFSNTVRDAAQSVAVDKSESQRNVAFDALDDYIQRGDMGAAKDYLKRMSLTSATADQRTRIMGKERTVELLGEIQGDLDTLEANGINTGFFSGNYENLLAKVGQVKDPGMRKVATKVATAMMNYRRDMTGVQFGEREGKEYKTVFPNINKIGAFNKAAIDGLKETFDGDVNKFYSQSMGKENYNKLFRENSMSSKSEQSQQKVPQVGSMFNGEKVINVRRIK